MGKQKKRSYEEKEEIVKEKLSGVPYSILSEKYGVLKGTIANWKKKYLEGTLKEDKRGKSKQEVSDIEILKKSYALLMEIRSKQNK